MCGNTETEEKVGTLSQVISDSYAEVEACPTGQWRCVSLTPGGVCHWLVEAEMCAEYP